MGGRRDRLRRTTSTLRIDEAEVVRDPCRGIRQRSGSSGRSFIRLDSCGRHVCVLSAQGISDHSAPLRVRRHRSGVVNPGRAEMLRMTTRGAASSARLSPSDRVHRTVYDTTDYVYTEPDGRRIVHGRRFKLPEARLRAVADSIAAALSVRLGRWRECVSGSAGPQGPSAWLPVPRAVLPVA